MEITPKQAEEWLEKNTRNRPMSMSLATQYADDMANNVWRETHQGIAFFESGILADGQTRLKAITISKKPITMQVTFGVPDESGLSIDTHRKRTLSNQLAVSGAMPWLGKNEAAVALLLMNSDNSKQSRSIEKIMAFCKPHEDAFMFTKQHTSNSIRYVTVAPVKAAIVSAFKYENKSRLVEFCKCLTSGVMENKNDSAAIRLRERLISNGAVMQHTGKGRYEIMLLAMKAISLFCKNAEVTRLSMPKEKAYSIK